MKDLYDYEGTSLNIHDYTTPEMFGAKGDGTTDDTISIQNAINTKGIVLFGAWKTYKVTSTIRISKDTTLDLNGATLLCTVGHIFYNFPANAEYTMYNGNGNIEIRNGTIIGGAVSFGHGENIRLNNLCFENAIGDHFLEICACKDYIIKNCKFSGMTNLTGHHLEYINIDYCSYQAFPALYDGSPFYDGTKNKNLTVQDCTFSLGASDYAYGYDAIGVHSSKNPRMMHENITIRGNQITGFSGYAIRINDMQNVIVDANYMYNVANGIDIGTYACDNVVIANNFANLNAGGSFLSLGAEGCTNLVAFGNYPEENQ